MLMAEESSLLDESVKSAYKWIALYIYFYALAIHTAPTRRFAIRTAVKRFH